MERRYKDGKLEIERHAFRADIDFFIKKRHEYLLFGGYFLRQPSDIYCYNNQYGFRNNELIKKDIYFTFLFLRPLFEEVNKIKGKTTLFSAYHLVLTYKLVKCIHDENYRIYGNCYDYGLSNYLQNLYDLAIEFRCDLRTPDQKVKDNLKETEKGCFEWILAACAFFIVAVLMSLFSGC